MANTKSFIEHVVDLFAAIEPVATRPMFGGTSLLVDGLMIGFLDDDELFLKVDAESEPRASRGSPRPGASSSPTR